MLVVSKKVDLCGDVTVYASHVKRKVGLEEGLPATLKPKIILFFIEEGI